MTDRVEIAGLRIARALHDFVDDEALPGTGVDGRAFWPAFRPSSTTSRRRTAALLAKRDALQEKIDAWYRENGAPVDMAAYKAFLREIGYLAAGRRRTSRSTTDECRSRDRRRSPGRSWSCRS